MAGWQKATAMITDKKAVEIISSLKEKYNGDYDTIPGLPQVTYTEMEMLAVIEYLVSTVDAINADVLQIKRVIETHERDIHWR